MKLVIEDDGGGRMEIPLERDELTIGRDASNHVRLQDRNVSRHHCRLFRTDDGLLVEDLQSSNGLSVNGDMMTGRRPVQVGDRIEIGDYRISIEDEAAGAVAARAPSSPPRQPPAPPKRKPTPIPKFPGLPKALEVTPGPPRALAYRQAEFQAPATPARHEAPAQHQPPAQPLPPAPAQAGLSSDALHTPGPRLAPLLARTPGPGESSPGPANPVGSFGKTPGPSAPTLAITPGPAAAIHAGTPGPGIAPSVSTAKESPRLVILSGELAGTSIALPREAAWLGSDPAGEIVLPHASIAPRHCRIEPLTSRGYRIVRADPEAELTVNGISSNEALFRPDDLIRIGSVLLRFVDGGR